MKDLWATMKQRQDLKIQHQEASGATCANSAFWASVDVRSNSTMSSSCSGSSTSDLTQDLSESDFPDFASWLATAEPYESEPIAMPTQGSMDVCEAEVICSI